MVFGEQVRGVEVDAQTRCVHFKSDLDIIAIKFRCCGEWFPCFECHLATTGHEAEIWPENEFSEKAILCGSCGYQLTIAEYLAAASRCPKCQGGFNPGCFRHYHLYFAVGCSAFGLKP